MNKKTIIAAATLAALTLGLAGCSAGSKEAKEDNASKTSISANEKSDAAVREKLASYVTKSSDLAKKEGYIFFYGVADESDNYQFPEGLAISTPAVKVRTEAFDTKLGYGYRADEYNSMLTYEKITKLEDIPAFVLIELLLSDTKSIFTAEGAGDEWGFTIDTTKSESGLFDGLSISVMVHSGGVIRDVSINKGDKGVASYMLAYSEAEIGDNLKDLEKGFKEQ